MKKIYTTVFACAAVISLAQIPTNGLVFKQEFTGNFTETSATNATSSANTSSLTTDKNGVIDNAAYFNTGQYIRYPFSTNPALMAGSSSKEITISVSVKIDSAFVANLPAADQYLNILKNGECFIRIRKSGSPPTHKLFLQTGVYNAGPDNFGYSQNTILLKDYTPGNIDSDTINYQHNKWNTFALTYYNNIAVGNYPEHQTFVNGLIYGGNTATSYTTLPVSYNQNTEGFVIGQPSGALYQSFKGTVDNVYIYDRTLSASEINSLASLTSVVSVNENKIPSFKIYPNPATDFISINLDVKPINGTKVCIINSLGEVVLSEMLKTQNTTLHINDLIDGVYFIKMESNKGTITKKFIKQ